VAKVLQKSQQSDFERTLFRGIHWFAASQKQFERENELLNLMTCVETFLAPPDGRSVKNEVARGVALLLATEPEMRKVLKEKVRDLYRVRSEISHGGQQIVLEQHLVELRTIAINLIFQMIERKEEFTSQKSLISWLKNQ
jgi:Apea-like HEPN